MSGSGVQAEQDKRGQGERNITRSQVRMPQQCFLYSSTALSLGGSCCMATEFSREWTFSFGVGYLQQKNDNERVAG